MFDFHWTECTVSRHDDRLDVYIDGTLYCHTENARDAIALISAIAHIQKQKDL